MPKHDCKEALVNDMKSLGKNNNAFQTKMWHSNLGKFRTILVFAAEKLCASERFGKLEGEK